MTQAQQILVNLIESLSEEKILRLLSYANFIKQESDDILFLESDDEMEIKEIIQKNKYYSEKDINDTFQKVI